MLRLILMIGPAYALTLVNRGADSPPVRPRGAVLAGAEGSVPQWPRATWHRPQVPKTSSLWCWTANPRIWLIFR